MDNYPDTTTNVYRDAALKPDVGLCWITSPMNAFPGLELPAVMKEMNYGCVAILGADDLVNGPKILICKCAGETLVP